MAERDRFELDLAAFLRDYAEDAPTEIRPGELARQFADAYPHRRGVTGRWSFGLSPALAWTLLLAGLLLALAGALFVGSRLLERTPPIPERPSVLAPSGVETLSDRVLFEKTVIDGTGVLWAIGHGAITRYDPTTRTGRTWTVDDDLRFAALTIESSMTPARAGGVWLVGTQELVRFDGTDFREAVDVGTDVMAATEAPDGSLWVVTADGDVVHLGSSRTRIAAPHPGDATIGAIAVDEAGRVWCGGHVGTSEGGWVSRFDGSNWQTFDEADAAALRRPVAFVTPVADGSVWVGTPSGLASFDGATWTDVSASEPSLEGGPPWRGGDVVSVAAGADGSIWAGFETPKVARLSGDAWTFYGQAEGLPGQEAYGAGARDAAWSSGVWMIDEGDRVFAGTGAGIYELTDGDWGRVWPETQPVGPYDSHVIVAISRDEAWAAGSDIWHYLDGEWSATLTVPPREGTTDLLRTPDGDMWASTGGGLYLWSGSAWSLVSEEWAAGLGADPDGRIWAIGGDTLRSYGQVDGRWTEQVRLVDLSGLVGRDSLLLACLAFRDDGTLWIGGGDHLFGGGGLFDYVGDDWGAVDPRDGGGEFIVTDLAVAPDGDLWAVGADLFERVIDTEGTVSRGVLERWVARFDGAAWDVRTEAETPVAQPTTRLAVAPDGAIWVGTEAGLLRFDGATWSVVHPGTWFSAVSVAPDGTVWVVSPSGVGRLTDIPVPE